MDAKASRSQLNVRVSERLEREIDKKRIELSKELGFIPSRSDVLRYALADYLSFDIDKWEADGRKVSRK